MNCKIGEAGTTIPFWRQEGSYAVFLFYKGIQILSWGRLVLIPEENILENLFCSCKYNIYASLVELMKPSVSKYSKHRYFRL